ncbi:MAG TPA: hypothetical protein VFQ45_21815 [Longimicrobium sp.]|nr:hypothetical protein [Longimicrobium sp.]
MRFPKFPLLVVATLLAAGCSDAGTLPEAPEAPVAAPPSGPANDYVLDPVIVIGTPECDPYMEADWSCDDGGGECMTSYSGGEASLASCPGGTGGGGGGGGGGGTGGSTGGTGTTTTTKQDAAACPGCGERAPTEAEKKDMVDQLSTIACADVRNDLIGMFNNGKVLVYTKDDGRYAGWDSRTGTIFISRPRHWAPDGTVNALELADSMVHEAVHKALGHVYGQPDSETHKQAFLDKMASCGFPQGGAGGTAPT